MPPTDHFATEQRIELALSTLNKARENKGHIPTYRELALDYEVPRSTLGHHDHGRIPRKEDNERKRYLTIGEEEVLVNWCLEIQDYCFPPRISLVKEMAIYLYSKRNAEHAKSIGCNWHLAFLDHHPELGIKYSGQIEHV
ncbi:hypothetical protein C7212DRAFT_280078 [Tuber magnatum]|uniref:HTH CENPB-type domain-containing protein n=1 Tax=Tuber magnatum TaxID=42249 RepID=A0A317SNR4_9PEZI|nr:hypothetical protein C7212DRAFT_280078 [Tuber magnatum]